MLESFSKDQLVPYKILVNSLKNNSLSHAYLFETNNYNNGFDMAKAFAKYLLCEEHHLSVEDGNNCKHCLAINNNNCTELKIIDSDGLWIKKEQLDELQRMFSTKTLNGGKKVYIINNAERLNIQAANSILKFLEEPEPDIVAILVTSNKYLLLDTIVSRCQIISLKDKNTINNNMNIIEKIGNYLFNSKDQIDEFVGSNKSEEMINKVLEFTNYYEKNGKDTLLFTNKLWHSVITDKESIYNALTIMVLLYKDILNMKLQKNLEFFNEDDNLKYIEKKNTISNICDKINVILKERDKIRYNINAMLLIDKLIIDLEETK